MPTGLDTNPSKLGNGGNEGLLEGGLVGREDVHDAPRSRIREEDLVGGEEACTLLEVLEVLVVKRLRGDRVHVDGNGWVSFLGAHLLQLPSICWVQCGINAPPPLEIVNSLCKFAAVGEADCVCTCILRTSDKKELYIYTCIYAAPL